MFNDPVTDTFIKCSSSIFSSTVSVFAAVLKIVLKSSILMPKTDYKTKISIEPSTLSRIIFNMEHISEYLTISCNQEGVEFSGQGDAGNGKISLDKKSPDLKKLESVQDSSAVYSLEYMAKIIRDIGKASKTVNMEYADKNPIHILFEMPSMAIAEYYLAPRVQD